MSIKSLISASLVPLSLNLFFVFYLETATKVIRPFHPLFLLIYGLIFVFSALTINSTSEAFTKSTIFEVIQNMFLSMLKPITLTIVAYLFSMILTADIKLIFALRAVLQIGAGLIFAFISPWFMAFLCVAVIYTFTRPANSE